MPDVLLTLTDRLTRAITAALGDDYAWVDPQIRPSNTPKFGDYQANFAMGLAKRLGSKPRDIAQQVVDHLDTAGLCEKVEIAGPGFINLHLSTVFLNDRIAAMAGDDERLGVASVQPPQTVVVDYSGPNVAKEMHVGHLRSTVIGDCIARVLAFQGHDVKRQNHLGDWGTQFGMLIEYMFLFDYGKPELELSGPDIADLNAYYQDAKKEFDKDSEFADRSRQRVVNLQAGDSITRQRWQDLIDASKRHFNPIYNNLDTARSIYNSDNYFDREEELEKFYKPESSYNAMLPGVIDELEKAGLLQESQGAKVVFPEGFKNRDGDPQAMIVQKSDGGYLYATTDLAAARYRIEELKADRIVYVTDARQSQHFAMVFATLRQAHWAPDNVRLDHVPFGTVLGKDNKPFKTREGGTVKLVDLLDEAEKRAAQIIAQKNSDLPDAQRNQIAHAVGIGALKYADLSNDRIKDYVFDWDRMLSFEGNTAPYLQNAYVRIRSIFRKGGVEPGSLQSGAITVDHDAERALAVKLLQLPEVIDAVAQSLEPHRLCTYLYELASAFHQFYEKCPVLKVESSATRDSRLALCDLVAQTLRTGLGMLGITVIEQM